MVGGVSRVSPALAPAHSPRPSSRDSGGLLAAVRQKAVVPRGLAVPGSERTRVWTVGSAARRARHLEAAPPAAAPDAPTTHRAPRVAWYFPISPSRALASPSWRQHAHGGSPRQNPSPARVHRPPWRSSGRSCRRDLSARKSSSARHTAAVRMKGRQAAIIERSKMRVAPAIVMPLGAAWIAVDRYLAPAQQRPAVRSVIARARASRPDAGSASGA